MRASEAGFVAVLLTAALPMAAHAQANPAPVIAAERAFAARAAEVGVARSFLDFMTDDAVMFAPAPVNARELYSSRPPGKAPKDGGPLLAWWPNWAGMSRAGDLGFTTGPAELNGKRSVNYFTVWAKQPTARGSGSMTAALPTPLRAGQSTRRWRPCPPATAARSPRRWP